jgi:hypothetical protein
MARILPFRKPITPARSNRSSRSRGPLIRRLSLLFSHCPCSGALYGRQPLSYGRTFCVPRACGPRSLSGNANLLIGALREVERCLECIPFLCRAAQPRLVIPSHRAICARLRRGICFSASSYVNAGTQTLSCALGQIAILSAAKDLHFDFLACVACTLCTICESTNRTPFTLSRTDFFRH